MQKAMVGDMLGDHLAQLAGWREFYHEIFGLDTDFSPLRLRIPEKREGFDRLIVVADGITPQQVYEICENHFSCWKWTEKSLDEIVVNFQARSVNGSYAIWLRNRIEADEELENLSMRALKEKGVPGINLAERLLLEIKHFRETGQHLDVRSTTLCVGSRCLNGGVPAVRWGAGSGGCDSGCLDIAWFSSTDSHPGLRSREVVS